MKYVVNYSGGVGSWAAARRVVDKYGKDNVILLFADTKMEDEDLYRFLDDSSSNLGLPIIRVADGRTPWEVFRDVKFLGNSRVDPCSRVLKRELLDKWIKENCDLNNTTLVFGIDWAESHRLKKIEKRLAPMKVWAPMCDSPYLTKEEMLIMLRGYGIKQPRLYDMGFIHNNCGGFCIKAGQSHFKLLYEQMPERYLYHEQQERELRELLGKEVTILKDQKGKKSTPVSLEEFRKRIDAKESIDPFDWGGCGCALDYPDDPLQP